MAPRPLSLAPLSLPGLGPEAFVACAARAGFRHVALRSIAGDPRRPPDDMPCLIGDPAVTPGLRARLDGEGMTVTELEFVALEPDIDVADCRPGLEIGAVLGARWLVVGNLDPERTRAADRLAALARLAREHAMQVVVEFVPYTATRTLADAVALIADCDEQAFILVDALHLDRSGGDAAQVAALPGDLFPYVQLCDAPAGRPVDLDGLRREAREARCAPGTGGLDLTGLLAALPGHLAVSIEAPDLPRIARIGELAYAVALREATEALFARLEPGQPS